MSSSSRSAISSRFLSMSLAAVAEPGARTDTGVCLHVNSDRAGGAYGYVDMGGYRRPSTSWCPS
jgi:hypothetical protein